jgi:TolB protein
MPRRIAVSRLRNRARGLGLLLIAFAFPTNASAQRPDTSKVPTGVRLRLTYTQTVRPQLAVRPFGGPTEVTALQQQVTAIVQKDLDFSDRFAMADIIPEALRSGPPDFKAWNSLGVVYLVTGEVAPASGGFLFHVVLYDVVYGTAKQAQTYSLPAQSSPDFRMAVHAASDDIVRWATGQPGMAASRVVFRRKSTSGDELMVIDSDGENMRRLAGAGMIMSPAWSPDGRRIAYTQQTERGWQLVEHTVATNEVRVLTARNDFILTPSYSPDGRKLAFAMWTGSSTEIQEYDVAQNCCIKRLSKNPRDDMYPSYSPDGGSIAFMSNRIGQPHIYIMPAQGGDATLLSPYVFREPGYYTSPDWSPLGNRVAFHGRSRGAFQIMTADPARPGSEVQQITSSGRNEDPTWAPDGRHLLFTGVREQGSGLYVMDVEGGRLRPLILGGRFTIADWSPGLAGK